MNDKLWTIETPSGQDSVTCEVCGVAQDGSLICFIIEGQDPKAIKGYAPGQWLKFSRSTIRVN